MRNGEIYRLLNIIDKRYDVSLDLPTGSCATVGLSGFILGGGHSIVTSWIGKACHYLHSVELCLPSGEIQEISDQTNPDLMKVLRGGGQNIGVVLTLTLNLPYRNYYNLIIYQRDIKTKEEVLDYFLSIENMLNEGYREFTTLNLGNNKATIITLCPTNPSHYGKNLKQLRQLFDQVFNRDKLYREVIHRENITWSDIWMDSLDGLSFGG